MDIRPEDVGRRHVEIPARLGIVAEIWDDGPLRRDRLMVRVETHDGSATVPAEALREPGEQTEQLRVEQEVDALREVAQAASDMLPFIVDRESCVPLRTALVRLDLVKARAETRQAKIDEIDEIDAERRATRQMNPHDPSDLSDLKPGTMIDGQGIAEADALAERLRAEMPETPNCRCTVEPVWQARPTREQANAKLDRARRHLIASDAAREPNHHVANGVETDQLRTALAETLDVIASLIPRDDVVVIGHAAEPIPAGAAIMLDADGRVDRKSVV